MPNFLLGSGTPPSSSFQVSLRSPQAPQPTAEVFRLESRMDALELACAALWQLLKSKQDYSDEEISAVMKEVDARDGKVDGRIQRKAEDCPVCGRRLLTRRRDQCLWCGSPLESKPF